MTPRQRLSAAQRREEIVAAALDQFGRRGYVATSIEDIVGAAGVTAPVLYDHFASKRELYIELMERQTDELVTRVATAVLEREGTAAQLRAAYDAFFGLVEEQPFTWRMVAGSQSGDEVIAAAEERRDARSREAVATLVAEHSALFARRPHRRRAIELVVQAVRHGLNGIALWWQAHPEVARRELVDRAMDVTWSGLAHLTTRDALSGRAAVLEADRSS